MKEAEVLFRPNTSFIIMQKKKIGYTYYLILKLTPKYEGRAYNMYKGKNYLESVSSYDSGCS